MKIVNKVTDFIVDKRYFILGLFMILAVMSAICSTKVVINNDISKYLPEDSMTRIGLDIMDSKMKELKSSSFNLMFKDLKKVEKKDIYNDLVKIKGVDSVDYEIDSKNYNNKNYTLYVIHVGDTDDSKLAASVFKKITHDYKDYEIYTSGDIASKNATVLSIWIVVIAVCCALVILIIMCHSYAEPFLFLAAILLAVLLNRGSNIIFDHVSNITSSISAILQMALSMDYSIMLMSRYNQEKRKEKDRIKAMKKALTASFISISSSSLTTIVGLLALVFMSFTIGRDLGFVLAKGVFLSLLTIFTCLPSFILIFDQFIEKTQKKSPVIKFNSLGKFSYKIRHLSIFLFFVIFTFSILVKGNLKILYTENEDNKVKDYFTENNQMALIYKNKEEDKIGQYCKSLEQKKGVDEVLCYANTIGEKLKYNDVNHKLDRLGVDVSVDDYLLKILFYHYYNQTEKDKMTFDELVPFVKNEVYHNKEISSRIDESTKQDINNLSYFTTVNLMNQKRTSTEISQILGIDQNSVDDILVYYGSKNVRGSLTLSEFVKFMNQEVLPNQKYAKNIDYNTRNHLAILTKFTDYNTIHTRLNFYDQSKLFGIDSNLTEQLYLYYIMQSDVDNRLSISEFVTFTQNYILTDSKYQDNFSDIDKKNLEMLKTFSNQDLIDKEMNYDELSLLFGVEKEKVKKILLLQYQNDIPNEKMTFPEFVSTVDYLKNNTSYLKDQDVSSITNLKQIDEVMQNQSLYSADEMASIMRCEGKDIYSLYNLVLFSKDKISNWKMSPKHFVTFILSNKDSLEIDSSLFGKLQLIDTVMATSSNTFYTYSELSKILGLDCDKTKTIYTLYRSMNTSLSLSPYEFVSFLLNHRNDEMLKKKLTKDTISSLQLVNTIMTNSISNTRYSVEDLSKLLGIRSEELKLIYSFYHYKNQSVTISLKDIVDFLLSDVVVNDEYRSNFNSDQIKKLNTIKGIMNSTINNTKYTKNEMFGVLSNLSNDIDSKMIDLLYMYYGSNKKYSDNWTMSIEELVYYLSNKILKDDRFNDFIDQDMRKSIISAKKSVGDAKDLLVGDGYSRVVLNTRFDLEGSKTFDFIKDIKMELKKNNIQESYMIGNSPMAYDISNSFDSEMNFITILTMIMIFVVVAFTFKSLIIPLVLVLLIQCAVYLTMGILSFAGGTVYFIALLIVQSILMGATIDYAILYTSYYLENRKRFSIKESIIKSYNKSINTIITSSSILMIVTLVVACFSNAICAKICKTLSQGTLCSVLLILLLLPSLLALFDPFIVKKKESN